jgi:hypothetical protein
MIYVCRLFTYDETQRIEELSFYDILMSVTGMDWNDIPKNSFRVPMTSKLYLEKL